MRKLSVKKTETAGKKRPTRGSCVLAAVFVFVLFLMCSGTVFAAVEAWNTIMAEAMRWVTRLGIVVLVIGGIMLGLGFKNDDAEQKSRGVGTMVAGGIVAGVCAVAGPLLTAS
jgi:hypothetical protein